jgi:hypothetical protein
MMSRAVNGPVIPAVAVLVLLLTAPVGLSAQRTTEDPHAAQPQRPTVATHAGTMAPGWVEIEVGTEFDRFAGGSQGALAPMLLKLGLAPRFHLEAQAPIVSLPGQDTTGLGDFTLGLKWRLVEDAPIVGDFAILPSLKMPSGSAGVGSETTDFGFLFISSHAIGQVAMDLNLGFTRRSGNGTMAPPNASLWTVSFGGPGNGPVGWVAEIYGYPATSGPAGADSIVALLLGPTLQVRKWLVLDVGVIGAIAGPQPRAVYVGATYNVGRIWGF